MVSACGQGEKGCPTVLVLSSKVLCPWKSLDPRRTRTTGYPGEGTRPRSGQRGRVFGQSWGSELFWEMVRVQNLNYWEKTNNL